MKQETEKQENKQGENEFLSRAEMEEKLKDIPEWKIVHQDSMNKLMREYTFKDFSQVLEFTSRMKKFADKEGHDPILQSTWGRVTIYWWTHSLHGLQQQDFDMALGSDRIFSNLQKVGVDES
ncbi:MAG: 4a-hydroxytetrahydrobiopterin dehydratase [Chloroflexi bacterium]|nr:4a-hydroxytetrahydrobiopterin dehydratase [Chloroflexota bacterium]